MPSKTTAKKECHHNSNLLRTGLRSVHVILILLSLCLVLWQGYLVTVTYLSQPISTEQKLMPLNSIPNIVMSICKVIEISNCTIGVAGKKTINSCSSQQLPAYVNKNYGNFWNITEDGEPSFQLRDILDSIHAWNEPENRWNTVFDSSTMTIEEEKAQFYRQMYPYSGNHTMLCYTFQKDIRNLVPMLKFQRKGK
jgi:hypothetical protein